MMMPGRTYSAGSGYRYGFNGKENDNETYGEGNIYDYGFRIYNPRLGKFLSVDPLTKSYPWYTPYQFAGNKPIIAIDLDGLEELIRINFHDTNGKYLKSVFIPLSTKETAEAFNDVWADINGLGKYRKAGSVDRFNNKNSVMDPVERKDYEEGNILSKYTEGYKAPYTGQLTIDVKPGSDYLFNISYSRNLVHDKEYGNYLAKKRVGTLFDLGYLTSDALSGIGKVMENGGLALSVTPLGPGVGGPIIAGGGTIGMVGDGLEIGLDYLRKDYKLANKKLLTFTFERILDKVLSSSAKLDPNQKPKTDAIGVVVGDGADEIRGSLQQDPKLQKSKQADTKKAVQILKNLRE